MEKKQKKTKRKLKKNDTSDELSGPPQSCDVAMSNSGSAIQRRLKNQMAGNLFAQFLKSEWLLILSFFQRKRRIENKTTKSRYNGGA